MKLGKQEVIPFLYATHCKISKFLHETQRKSNGLEFPLQFREEQFRSRLAFWKRKELFFSFLRPDNSWASEKPLRILPQSITFFLEFCTYFAGITQPPSRIIHIPKSERQPSNERQDQCHNPKFFLSSKIISNIIFTCKFPVLKLLSRIFRK